MILNTFEIQKYLPRWLSEGEITALLNNITGYPNSLKDNTTTTYIPYKEDLIQGDIIDNLPLYNYTKHTVTNVKGLIVSNSCDLSSENRRIFGTSVVFAPIFLLEKYKDRIQLVNDEKPDSQKNHIEAIIKQRVTQMFFLPSGNGLENCFARFDMLQSFQLSHDLLKNLVKSRVCGLSNFGYYLLLMKTCKTCKWFKNEAESFEDEQERGLCQFDIGESHVWFSDRCSKWESKLERRCVSCEFFEWKGEDPGECRRTFPNSVGSWPKVFLDDCCGEFRGRE